MTERLKALAEKTAETVAMAPISDIEKSVQVVLAALEEAVAQKITTDKIDGSTLVECLKAVRLIIIDGYFERSEELAAWIEKLEEK